MLLDTDVLLDVALDREPYSAAASELLDRIERGSQTAFVAWHSVSNFYDLVSPASGGRATRDFIVELTRFVQVAEPGSGPGRGSAMTDFETPFRLHGRACGASGRDHLTDYKALTDSAVTPGGAQRVF